MLEKKNNSDTLTLASLLTLSTPFCMPPEGPNPWPTADQALERPQRERVGAPRWIQDLFVDRSVIDYYDFETDVESKMVVGVCAHQLIEQQREVAIDLITKMIGALPALSNDVPLRTTNLLRVNRIKGLEDISLSINDAATTQDPPILAQQLLATCYQHFGAQEASPEQCIEFLTNLLSHLQGSLTKFERILKKIPVPSERQQPPERSKRKEFFKNLLPGTEVKINADPPTYMIYSGVDDEEHPTRIIGTCWPERAPSLLEGKWMTEKIPEYVADPGRYITTMFQTPTPEEFSNVEQEQWDNHWFDQTVNSIRIRLLRTADGYAMSITDSVHPPKNQQETLVSFQFFPQGLAKEKIKDDFDFIVQLAQQGNDIEGLRQALADSIAFANEETEIRSKSN